MGQELAAGRALALGCRGSPIWLPHRTGPQVAYIIRTERGLERGVVLTQAYWDVWSGVLVVVATEIHEKSYVAGAWGMKGP